MSVKRYTLRSIYKALSSGQDLEMPDCDVIAETDYDALDAQFAELRQHLGTLTPGGSHTCITCAAHVKVITEDLEPRIRALEADLIKTKQERNDELRLRQTAEAYAARNALRVIELEASGNDLRASLVGMCHINDVMPDSVAERVKRFDDLFVTVPETKGEQG